MRFSRIASLLTTFLLALTLAACATPSAPSPAPFPSGDSSMLERGSAWLTDAYGEDCVLLQSTAYGEQLVLLAGNRNPGTEAFGSLEVFVLEEAEGGFTLLASKAGDMGISAGFSAAVLSTDSMTVLFGDLTDSIFDFVNGQRLPADFTQVTVELRDGSTLDLTLTSAEDYVFPLEPGLDIADVVFHGGQLTVRYSDFFGQDLMEDSAPDAAARLSIFFPPPPARDAEEKNFFK